MSNMPSFSIKVPPAEDRERRVCDTCGFIDYQNPKIVAGVVAAAPDGRILLCKRAIEPRRGYWTLPAGFMELGETVEQGAAREAREEACVELEIGDVLGVYSVPRIGQVHIFFAAKLLNEPSPGPESLDVTLAKWEDIPWKDLAFPSVTWALEHYRAWNGRTGLSSFVLPQAPGM